MELQSFYQELIESFQRLIVLFDIGDPLNFKGRRILLEIQKLESTVNGCPYKDTLGRVVLGPRRIFQNALKKIKFAQEHNLKPKLQHFYIFLSANGALLCLAKAAKSFICPQVTIIPPKDMDVFSPLYQEILDHAKFSNKITIDNFADLKNSEIKSSSLQKARLQDIYYGNNNLGIDGGILFTDIWAEEFVEAAIERGIFTLLEGAGNDIIVIGNNVSEKIIRTQVVPSSVKYKVVNNGRSCSGPKQWYVREDQVEIFFYAICEEADKDIKIGEPTDITINVGFLTNPQHVNKCFTHFTQAYNKPGVKVYIVGNKQLNTQGTTIPLPIIENNKKQSIIPFVVYDPDTREYMRKQPTYQDKKDKRSLMKIYPNRLFLFNEENPFSAWQILSYKNDEELIALIDADRYGLNFTFVGDLNPKVMNYVKNKRFRTIITPYPVVHPGYCYTEEGIVKFYEEDKIPSDLSEVQLNYDFVDGLGGYRYSSYTVKSDLQGKFYKTEGVIDLIQEITDQGGGYGIG